MEKAMKKKQKKKETNGKEMTKRQLKSKSYQTDGTINGKAQEIVENDEEQLRDYKIRRN